MLFNQLAEGRFSAIAASSNPPLNFAPFNRWTMRDKAAPVSFTLGVTQKSILH